MRRVVVLLLFVFWCCVHTAQAHDRNLSGLRIQLEDDAVVILVDTHRSMLGEGEPKRAVGNRLRLILDGKPYVPVAPVVGVSQETDGVVWEDRVPHPVRSLEVVGTLYPENPKARLAVVVYDRDVAVRGAMLGPTLARWSFGKQPITGKSRLERLDGAVRSLRERWSGYRNPWLSLLALAILAGVGFRPRPRLAGLLAGLCIGALGHRWIGFGIADSLVEILTGGIVLIVSARVFAAPAGVPGDRSTVGLSAVLGMILGAGVGGSLESGFPSPIETAFEVAGTGLIAVSALSIAGWAAGRTSMATGPNGLSLRRSIAGLTLALAVGFGLLAQMPLSR